MSIKLNDTQLVLLSAASGEIYCLFSTEDGVPRYVGQTEGTAAKRRQRHIARALDHDVGALYDWLRAVFAKKHDVGVHVLQISVPPSDLDMFEKYWISQFENLLNLRRSNSAPATASAIGRQVIDGIKRQLKNSEAAKA